MKRKPSIFEVFTWIVVSNMFVIVIILKIVSENYIRK